MAQNFNALVIYAEHRYFGESIPQDDPKKEHLKLENAMMDYLNLMKLVKEKYGVKEIVTFGGSYGGMLATWMRMKYPSMVSAAVVSGAPILYFKDNQQVPEPIFF